MRVEDGPCNLYVAGRIADAYGSPVDHTGNLPLPDEQIACVEVAVNAQERAVPLRCIEGHFPGRGYCGCVDRVGERADSGARGLVAWPERAAAAGWGRPSGRIDAPQRSEELRKIDGCAGQAEIRARRVHAVEPVVNRPLVRISIVGHATSNWRRYFQWQQRPQLGPPLELFV